MPRRIKESTTFILEPNTSPPIELCVTLLRGSFNLFLGCEGDNEFVFKIFL